MEADGARVRIYGLILNCASKPFEEGIRALGLPLGAMVDVSITQLNADSPSTRRRDSRPS